MVKTHTQRIGIHDRGRRSIDLGARHPAIALTDPGEAIVAVNLDNELGDFIEFGIAPAWAVDSAGTHGHNYFVDGNIGDSHGDCPFRAVIEMTAGWIKRGTSQKYSIPEQAENRPNRQRMGGRK
jgi:hypothetical protein